MALDLTSFDSALKQYYTDNKVEDLVYKNNPFLAMVTKMTDFQGKNLPVPLIYGNPQGRSATFTNAQTRGGVTNTQVTDFVLTRVSDYSIATIDNETLEASKGNKGAFIEAATTEINGAINSLTRSLAVSMYRSSAGEIGQVSAEPAEAASTVITMKSAGDITNIEVGMALNIWSALSGGSQRNLDGSTTQLVVSAVDRSAGTFTVATAYDASGTIAADDYIFVEGDRGIKLSGLAGWLPATAPGAAAFFGVDRTADVTRLGGIRYDGSSDPIEEALIEGASRAQREGAMIDTMFISFSKYAELQKAMQSRVQYVDINSEGSSVSFRGIALNSPTGVIQVLPDMNCPDSLCYGLQLDTWKLYSLGNAVRIDNPDGLSMLRQAAADGVEVRARSYSQLGCKAPGYNVVISL